MCALRRRDPRRYEIQMSLATIAAGLLGESQYTLTQQAGAGTGDVTAVHAQHQRNHVKLLAAITA